MTLSRERRLINGVWRSVTVDETGGGGGGSLTEVVADDASIEVSNGTGPVVGLSADIPFVGADPPDSPTDGMLWWDPDDDTPSGSQPVFAVPVSLTIDKDTPVAGVTFLDLKAGDRIFSLEFDLWTAFDGTTPHINLYEDGQNPDSLYMLNIDAADFSSYGWNSVDNDVGDIVSFPEVGPSGGLLWTVVNDVVLKVNLSDGAGGNPGSTHGRCVMFALYIPATNIP